MKKKWNSIYLISSLVALVIAIFLGIFAKDFSKGIKFIGDWYVTALKIVVSPLIFAVMSLFVLKRENGPKFLITKTVILFIIMFAITFIISGVIVYFAKPGAYFTSISGETPSSKANFDILAILQNLLPKSLNDVFMGKNIFFVIIVALLSAFIISFIKPIKKDYIVGLEHFKTIIDWITKAIIFVTPLAIISLVSNMIVSYDTKAFGMGLLYILFAYGLSIIALLLVMILPVWIFAKVNPITYIKKASKVWLVSLTTCSSLATLPHTMRVCNEDFNVDERITNIVVPLGCTIHMCGGAVSFSLLGLFVAQMSGITITFPTFLLMLLVATLINMAAPGIPGGGKIIGFTYLSIFGLPINTFYGMYVAIYSFLDMAYTTLNVTGDVSANILLNKYEKKNLEKIKQKEEIK